MCNKKGVETMSMKMPEKIPQSSYWEYNLTTTQNNVYTDMASVTMSNNL